MNRKPCDERLFRFGVLEVGWPYTSKSPYPKSSANSMTIFGRVAANVRGHKVTKLARISRKQMNDELRSQGAAILDYCCIVRYYVHDFNTRSVIGYVID